MELPTRFIVQATRYLLGRKTIDVAEHVNWLINNWYYIPTREKQVIVRDIEQEFDRDDKLRQDGHGPLGMDIDRQEWEKVRQIYYSKCNESITDTHQYFLSAKENQS